MNESVKSYTHVALVLDASGSMTPLREATIKMLKEFFASLNSPDDKTVVDIWQFNGEVRHLVDGVDIGKGADDAIENYSTGGRTALYDAVCTGIDELGRKFAAMPESERPDAVVFAILTDGLENASVEFTASDVKTRIEHQTGKYNWTFRFLAANQDAVIAGGRIGIGKSCCMNFAPSREGLSDACKLLSRACSVDARSLARHLRMKKIFKAVTVEHWRQPGKVGLTCFPTVQSRVKFAAVGMTTICKLWVG